MSDGVHRAAATGFADGADIYAASRPGYPAEVLDWLRDCLAIGPDSKVVEVGAGTGLFTRLLVDTGASVVATDPVPEMLAHLASTLPGAATAVATADALPLPDGSVDAVICATAFHWFATPQVVAEFRRVLRPGGALGLIWNVRDVGVPWVRRLSKITDRYQDDAPRQKSQAWRAVFPAPGFTPLHETVMRYDHAGTAEEVIVGRTLSTSFIAALPEDRRAVAVAEVRAMIADTPALAGRERVAFPYLTKAYDCRRIE
ncbi:MAG: methyltransferase domain-containing protein [Sphingomonas sp.]|uniref:class I SAM-dependent methyltransferase n=1 Tax=Sphingomonas sp. TaxID=28214 RepID=UPI003F802DE8